MPQILQMQSNFSGGVVDPRLIARTDTSRYYEALQEGENIVSIAHGGFKRRGGLTYINTLPNVYTNIALSGTASAPNGGTAANVNDDDGTTQLVTTTAMSTTDPYIVTEVDLGSSMSIEAVDVLGIYISGPTAVDADMAFKFQYSNNGVDYTDYGTPFTVFHGSTNLLAIRMGGAISARYIRLIKFGAVDYTTDVVTLNELRIFQNTSTLSETRLIKFTFSEDQEYVILLHDQGAQIYRSDTFDLVAYVTLPYQGGQIYDIDYTQSADTLILVHPTISPRRIRRGADHTDWIADIIDFTNVPQFNFNDDDSPAGVDEIQDITFNTFVADNNYVLELEGFLTNTIIYSATSSVNEARIQQALLDLRITPSTGITVSNTGGTTYRVTFTGESQDNWSPIALFDTNGSGTITQTDVQDGSAPKEDLWSATRGYPRTVTFHEQRLVFGGFNSLPNTMAFSVVGDFFNFDVFEGNDSDAIVVTISSDQINAITDLYSGRTLQIFTTGAEYHIPNVENQPITPSTVAIKRQTQHGSDGIGAFGVEGVTLFIDRGNVVREYVFDFVADQYAANSISLLAPHIINSVRDADVQTTPTDGFTTYFYLVNGDGTAVVLNILRQQEILAWTQWTTDGLIRSVTVSDDKPFFVVRRNINGVDYSFLEYVNDNSYTDSNVQVSQAASTTASGFDHLDGEECRVRADGFVLENNTPVAGSITMESDYSEIEVGLNYDVKATTMPYAVDTQAGNTFFKHKRIVRGFVELRDTLGIIIDGDRIPDRTFGDDILDTAPTPYNGRRELYALGWDTRKELTIEQTDPLPMTVLSIMSELQVS